MPAIQGHEADEAKFAGLLLLVKHLQQQSQQRQQDPLAVGDGACLCTTIFFMSTHVHSNLNHANPFLPDTVYI